jgi:hypothetical protein
VNNAAYLKVYRPPIASSVLGWVCCAIFLLVGLSMVTVGPSEHDAVGAGIVGTLTLLLAGWLALVLATNRLAVTTDGLVYTRNARRRVIGWPEVRSFGVGPSRTGVGWPCLVIRLASGSLTVSALASFTATYPSRMASELTALQHELAFRTCSGPR